MQGDARTIRELWEAVRDETCEEYQSPDLVSNPELIRRLYGYAVAALDQLDNAEREVAGHTTRYYTQHVLVLDPDPGVGAEHA